MRSNLPDFKAKAAREQAELGEEGVRRILDAGRALSQGFSDTRHPDSAKRRDDVPDTLSSTLRAGGSVIFPHAGMEVCGPYIAAAVHACLDSGAPRVLALGVLHALTQELEEARVRVANGADVTKEPAWGMQGPGLSGREDWRSEFSLSHFQFLWEAETKRRGIAAPELVMRYPYLAGGRPDILPGMAELEEIRRDAVVVATTDPFHHGIGYGDLPENARAPEGGGLDLARQRIAEGLALLQQGDYRGYNQHCVEARSDGRDVGQTLRYLLGPIEGHLLDVKADDMTASYHKPAPTWVACALIEIRAS